MNLRAELARVLPPERVLTRWIDRLAWANDASVYRLVPRAVVRPASIDEVRGLFRFAHAHRIPLTFRTAGTSLSGQAVTDGLLVDVARHFRQVEVLDGGRRVRVQPGAIGSAVNDRLRPSGTKIGPDPASINACMMGGILANNSSGMCCGVDNNAYHTLDAIRFVLPDGLLLDTRQPDAAAHLRHEAPHIADGLLDLRRSILDRPALRDRIRAKYRMKNTTGYSLNAFVDFEEPLQILARLMIGSEGTLGFIAEAVLRTIPDHPLAYTGLLFFADVESACAAIGTLRDSGAAALELMDRASLRAIQDRPGVPGAIPGLPDAAAALLVEYQCPDEPALTEAIDSGDAAVRTLPLLLPPELTRDADRRAALWRVRKGLIPSVGALRRRGTTFIIEDVVFPVDKLAAGVRELQRLFVDHGYPDGIVFGHAKDGNLHFVLTPDLDDPHDVRHYDAFMRELAVVVAGRYGGALKAEHGTGRNMAPFVETEWGSEAHRLMRDLKRLIDPAGVLNPGVILNDDPAAHLAHLKPLPEIEVEADRCIECGFCERHCPSRDLTLTPRQRIVVRRAMARLRADDPASPVLHELERDFAYAALDTCAADGLCATGCPVEIDTGRLVKRLRREGHGEPAHELATMAAERFVLVESAARAGLRLAALGRRALGPGALSLVRTWLPGLAGWDDPRPAPTALPRGSVPPQRAAGIYLRSCVTRVLGGGDPPLPEALLAVAARAGRPLHLPREGAGLCCGMPFSSKGYRRAARRALARTVRALWRWTEGGRLPVVVDTSPCAWTLKQETGDLPPQERAMAAGLRVLDGVEFAWAEVLPRLRPVRPAGDVVLHPVCSTIKMGLAGRLQEVAAAYADSAHVPLGAGCCGFAGDRGLTHPELTASATAAEAAEVNARTWDGHYSTSRTCEIALTRATARPYHSLWHLLERTTRP